jgi:hypothetical protein
MSESITFACHGCNKPYKVAASYAGRAFACKSCGAQLTVPQGSAPPPHESNVELNTGGEVIRRATTSGRQLSADPTRVFKHERETSARMIAVGPAAEAAPRGKGPLLALVVVAVLLVGGVGAAAALGVFSSSEAPGAANIAANEPAKPPSEESVRARILKQVDVPGQSAAEFMRLLKEAEEAKLAQADIVMISRAAVTAMRSEAGAGFSDAELMKFAERMEALGVSMDSPTLYGIVIERGRKAEPKSAEFKRAHELLGHAWIDAGPLAETIGVLYSSGVIEGMEPLRDELQDMEKRADGGWVIEADKRRFDEISKLVSDAQAEHERILREDPFRLKAADAQRRFKLEKASGFGHWVMLKREPFVFFVQLQGSEDSAADAELRLGPALAAAEQFPSFYRDELVKPMGLKRMLPDGLDEAAREAAPFVIKLFRNKSYLKNHLEEFGVHMDPTFATTFSEPGTGHLGMIYDEEKDSLGPFVRALIDVVMYNYHPRAPKNRAEDEAFKPYSSAILADYFHLSISYTGLDRTGGDYKYTFFQDDERPASLLKRWALPFAKGTNGNVDSLGGQLLTVRDFVSAKDQADLQETVKTKLNALPGWSEGDLLAANNANTYAMLGRTYARGLYQFLYHWNGQKYRESFLKFIRMDLAGEVDPANPVPAFEKAFGLDEAGWKKLEEDFTAYQS